MRRTKQISEPNRTVSEECESVQTKIESQMFEWYSEENCGEIVDNSPNGQKCLYRVRERDFLKHFYTVFKINL